MAKFKFRFLGSHYPLALVFSPESKTFVHSWLNSNSVFLGSHSPLALVFSPESKTFVHSWLNSNSIFLGSHSPLALVFSPESKTFVHSWLNSNSMATFNRGQFRQGFVRFKLNVGAVKGALPRIIQAVYWGV